MELRESLRQIAESLSDHPRRVLASSLGVFWGAAGMVVLLSFGAGFREYMKAEFSRFGEGVVVIHPASTSSGFPGYRKGVPVRIAREDARAVEDRLGERARAVLPEHLSRRRVLVEGGGRVRRLDLSASDPRFAALRGFPMAHGRYYDGRDVARRRAVAVLGHEAATILFGSAEAAVGERIRIDGRSFEVIGVPEEKGRQYMNTNRPDNRLVMIPASTAEARLGYDERALSRILVFPAPGMASRDVVRAVLEALGPRAGFHPDDEDAVHWYDSSEILGIVDLFYAGFMVFIGFAGTVTLLIGGVGMANYQLATLAERTTEIALARALGARTATLVRLTLAESLLVAGGTALAGVSLGLSSCFALAAVVPPGEYPLPIASPVVGGVTLAALCGVSAAAAILPAWKVRRMDLSAALRAS